MRNTRADLDGRRALRRAVDEPPASLNLRTCAAIVSFDDLGAIQTRGRFRGDVSVGGPPEARRSGRAQRVDRAHFDEPRHRSRQIGIGSDEHVRL
jgi:hypothetical protein